jgi:hypothetical protein
MPDFNLLRYYSPWSSGPGKSPASNPPVAMTRLTQTPIFSGIPSNPNAAGEFSPQNGGRITLTPWNLDKIYDSSWGADYPPPLTSGTNPTGRTVAHEEIHALLQNALPNMKRGGPVDNYLPVIASQLSAGGYSGISQASARNEGLAHAVDVGKFSPVLDSPDYWQWVRDRLSQLPPPIKDQYLRIVGPDARTKIASVK